MQPDLEHIAEQCRHGDRRAQQALYRHCHPAMIKICLRYAFGDADEAGSLYNAALLKVFQKIGDFRHEGALMGWIRRIVVTTCVDRCRLKAGFDFAELGDTAEYILPVLPEIYQKLSGNEIMRLVHRLPRNTGLVFNLFAMEGYKHEEIAAMLGISAGTSKWHLNDARRRLKENIESLLKKENLANAS